jgi:hypothetical protein
MAFPVDHGKSGPAHLRQQLRPKKSETRKCEKAKSPCCDMVVAAVLAED